MIVRLLHMDKKTELNNAAVNKSEIFADLNLDIVLKFMARGDEYIYKTARAVMLSPLVDKELILYRQDIIDDCVKNHDGIAKLYELISDIIAENEEYKEATKRANSSNLSGYAAALNTLGHLAILVKGFEKTKEFLDSISYGFTSKGLVAFYKQLCEEYSDEFVREINESVANLQALSEGGQITFSSCVGKGLKLSNIVINNLGADPGKNKRIFGKLSLLLNKLLGRKVIMLENSDVYESAKELEAEAVAHVARLYTGFIQELASFFDSLHYQIAFYLGAANLKIRMGQLHLLVCWPEISDDEKVFAFKGLYDLSLGIYKRETPVCNDLDAENIQLFVITGANQGGKSTYLRSIGLAQLMMQCGMFVPASTYSGRIYDGIFSHFTRREDTALNSGKLDEELARMDRILNQITPNSLLLLNESFASTTEKEGTRIALDVVNALYENGTKILMVTHLYEFTKTMFAKKLENAIFLSAERLPDGTRTYKILEKEPEHTSYGLDLYEQIIGPVMPE